MHEFLARLENSQASVVIMEDFRRINDICHQGMNLLIRASSRIELRFDADCPLQKMAMRLFLDHKRTFEFAWTRYLFYNPSVNYSFHTVPARLDIGEDHIERLRVELVDWTLGLAKNG